MMQTSDYAIAGTKLSASHFTIKNCTPGGQSGGGVGCPSSPAQRFLIPGCLGNAYLFMASRGLPSKLGKDSHP